MTTKKDWQLKANIEEETARARMVHAQELAGTPAASVAVVESAFDCGIAHAYEVKGGGDAQRHLVCLSEIKVLSMDLGVCPAVERMGNPKEAKPSQAMGSAATMVAKQTAAGELSEKILWGMDAAFYAGVAYGYATSRGRKDDQQMALSHYNEALKHLQSTAAERVRAANPSRGSRIVSIATRKRRLLR